MTTNHQPKAYSTRDPAALAAYRAATAAQREFARDIAAAAQELGNNTGALRARSVFGNFHTVGLAPANAANPPAGWVYHDRTGMLRPNPRTKAGMAARAWLAAHQPPPQTDLRAALEPHGLPRNDIVQGRWGRPTLFERAGELWALYRGTPGSFDNICTRVTWTPRRLSDYYAAEEAAIAAQTAEPGQAQGSELVAEDSPAGVL